MTKSEIASVLAVLKAAYPRQEITTGTADVYARFLADLPYEAALNAVKRHIATSQFFPAIAEIRKAAAESSAQVVGGEEAWGEVMRAVRSVGRYRIPQWSHPAVKAAVDALGWETICNSDEDNLGTLRAHFYRTFERYRLKAIEEVQVRPLLEPRKESPALKLVEGVAKKLEGDEG